MSILQQVPPRRSRRPYLLKILFRFFKSHLFFGLCIGMCMGYMVGIWTTSCPQPKPPVRVTQLPPVVVIGHSVRSSHIEEETSLIAPEFDYVRIPAQQDAEIPFRYIVRFDRKGTCMQIKNGDTFLPDACLLYGARVKNRQLFDSQYARTRQDEERWRLEEENASRF